jgi:hypothetical protein
MLIAFSQVINGEDSILEVKDISAMDCGKYTCILMNSAGNISTDIELSISGTPQNIISSPTESLYCGKKFRALRDK